MLTIVVESLADIEYVALRQYSNASDDMRTVQQNC
jgi:hypothetical protein